MRRGNLVRFILVGFLALSIPLHSFGSNKPDKDDNWQNLDPHKDDVMGVSTEKAYKKKLKKKKESKNVIVAVIDSGVDIEHEDLKGKIWVNEDEIPDNGIDDDNNGYIDDIHGWNFIGNSNGDNINDATLEVTRLYRKFSNMFAGMSEDEIKNSNLVDFSYYQNVIDTYKANRGEIEMKHDKYLAVLSEFMYCDSLLNLTVVDSLADSSLKASIESAALQMAVYLNQGYSVESLQEDIDKNGDKLNTQYNTKFDARKDILGDNVDVWESAFYGNADVEGDDPSHGTSVSGVICATRNNGIGVNGIAENVKIMSIRTVPNGDEWDKDVASAIKYAIDNGAQVINMSFGKSFSPQKEFVDSIARLVDKSDVLLVHAAGNDSKNIDYEANYPNKYSIDDALLANNWLTIGASSRNGEDSTFVANFSNYGIEYVDVFAPGHKMLLCYPDNEYEVASGTSFAAPVVSGVAALLKSYFPQLSAADIKEIILNSAVKYDYDVTLPGTKTSGKEIVKFNTLSNTGGLVNVYEAIILAEEKIK